MYQDDFYIFCVGLDQKTRISFRILFPESLGNSPITGGEGELAHVCPSLCYASVWAFTQETSNALHQLATCVEGLDQRFLSHHILQKKDRILVVHSRHAQSDTGSEQA